METNFYGRPSPMPAVCAPVSDALLLARVDATSARRHDADTPQARQAQPTSAFKRRNVGIDGINGLSAKRGESGVSTLVAASGVPPRGRPV